MRKVLGEKRVECRRDEGDLNLIYGDEEAGRGMV